MCHNAPWLSALVPCGLYEATAQPVMLLEPTEVSVPMPMNVVCTLRTRSPTANDIVQIQNVGYCSIYC